MKEDYCDQGGAADELMQSGSKEPRAVQTLPYTLLMLRLPSE